MSGLAPTPPDLAPTSPGLAFSHLLFPSARSVLEYYSRHKQEMQSNLQAYSEAQGKGFACWRFINERRAPRTGAHAGE